MVQNAAEILEKHHHADRRAVKQSNLSKVLLIILPTGWNFIKIGDMPAHYHHARAMKLCVLIPYSQGNTTVLRSSNAKARARALLLPLSVPSRRRIRRAAPVSARSPHRARWQQRGLEPFRHSEAVVGRRETPDRPPSFVKGLTGICHLVGYDCDQQEAVVPCSA
jgi:hypothetical protein